MQVINKPLQSLHPYDKNPRNNAAAVPYVANSIKEFGFKVPIIIDKDDVIVCGHTRAEAAKRLGLSELPCVVADDLTPDQIQAFRLADNKVSEMAQWDEDLLADELDDLDDWDMDDFGFLDDDDDEEIFDEEELSEPEPKENERLRTDRAYNLDLIDRYGLAGKYEMPIIENDHFIPDKLISFNYALSSKPDHVGVHFFIDDYQFERVWNDPEAYVEPLYKFDCVFSPDFSLYTDMPLAMKIWNVYRSRLVGNFYQQMGLKVIPTISWCEPATFEFCFDGIPRGSIVAISTIGVKNDPKAMKIWTDGMDAMIERIQPHTVIEYGGDVGYDYGKTKVIRFGNTNAERMASL